ncbi:MAG: hypothetical protein GTO40_22565 [Deltaproteobacteria bacterium]|nr:hypothetical protein [Deltaproteobacteria bacterium]
MPKDLPEEVEVKDELIQGYKETCHKTGILPHQAQALLDWFMGENTTQIQTVNEASEEYLRQSDAALRKEWGAAYAEKVALAQTAFDTFSQKMGKDGDEAITQLMEDTGLGNHPLMLKFFATIGAAIGEDVITGKPMAGALTPEQAQAEIAKVYGDKDHAYHKKDHAEHKIAVQKMQDLFKMAYPEETPAT